MKKSLIILFILMISVVSAETIDLIYPENVNIGEEFNITLVLNNFSEEIYDFKINFNNSVIEMFWDGGWIVADWMENSVNVSETNNQSFKFNLIGDYVGVDEIIVEIKNDTENWIFEEHQINISLFETENNETEPADVGVYLEMNWDEEDIVNGKEFEINVLGFNLEDEKHDVKIWIEFDENDSVISDRYDEENEEWKSGRYYVNDFFSGAGNKTEEIKLRIRKDYEDFYGDIKIFFKLRNGFEIEKEMEILGDEIDEEIEPEITNEGEFIETKPSITGNVIKLGASAKTEDIKRKNPVIYESNVEKIKKYSMFGFALLCVLLSVLLVREKL